jgi:hypothetical protein
MLYEKLAGPNWEKRNMAEGGEGGCGGEGRGRDLWWVLSLSQLRFTGGLELQGIEQVPTIAGSSRRSNIFIGNYVGYGHKESSGAR